MGTRQPVRTAAEAAATSAAVGRTVLTAAHNHLRPHTAAAAAHRHRTSLSGARRAQGQRAALGSGCTGLEVLLCDAGLKKAVAMLVIWLASQVTKGRVFREDEKARLTMG